jgi:hypothetical protein
VPYLHPPIKNGVPYLLSLPGNVFRGTTPRVPVSKKVLQVSAENRKGGSLGIRRKRPVFLDLNGHVTLSTAVAVFFELVNNAAVAEVIFVVDVDPVFGSQIFPATKPATERGLNGHFALAVWAVSAITEWSGHP